MSRQTDRDTHAFSQQMDRQKWKLKLSFRFPCFVNLPTYIICFAVVLFSFYCRQENKFIFTNYYSYEMCGFDSLIQKRVYYTQGIFQAFSARISQFCRRHSMSTRDQGPCFKLLFDGFQSNLGQGHSLHLYRGLFQNLILI